MSQTIIGIDAGGTWIKGALFTADLEQQKDVTLPSGAATGISDYLASIAEAVKELQAPDALIGVAMPANFTKDGRVRSMVNVKGLADPTNVPDVLGLLAKELGVNTVAVDNDAHCAALGEWQMGLGKGDPTTRLLHLTWGTGIGTSLITNGQPHFGWEGGHIAINWGTEAVGQCGCGSKHDLEALIAVPALIKQALQLIKAGTYTTQLEEADLEDPRHASHRLLELATDNDPLPQYIFEQACTWLARGLAAMSVIAMPDLITISGGLVANDWLLTKLHEAITTEVDGLAKNWVTSQTVLRAHLDNEAGVYGAAVLAQQKNK